MVTQCWHQDGRPRSGAGSREVKSKLGTTAGGVDPSMVVGMMNVMVKVMVLKMVSQWLIDG